MKDFFTKNLFLKIVALAFAIITWLYVNNEIIK